MLFHLVTFNTLQGRHHLEMWRGRCGGGNFFLQVFFGIILLCRIFLGSGYFFRYPFQYRIFLFCRIFPFFLFFCHPPPFQTDTKRFGEGERTFPMGEGGATRTKQDGGVRGIFYTTGIFFWVKRCHVFLGVLREYANFWGVYTPAREKLLLKYFKQRMSSRKMLIQKAIHCI